MTRGGARVGAGKKRMLSAHDALVVGSEFERLWIEAANTQALARHKQTNVGRKVDAAQSRTALIPIGSRKAADVRDTIEDVSDDIDDATGGQRFFSLELKRPYGARARITAAVVEWSAIQLGAKITPRQVRECWERYKTFQEWAENQERMKSAQS